VFGEIGYRNRSDDVAPTLTYGQEYFQRFEPLTAGDALKRVPSITFLSDVIESDGVRMRGLAPGYTQILVNGELVPGSNFDRSFFMDRIPAGLIERVEIVRSPSARRPADAMAGTLNIVLRDGYSLDGGYVRAGGLLFDDGEVKESLGGVWGGELGAGRFILGANVQGRYNPKEKQSFRYGDSPENNPNFATEEFDNREDQDDTRDGTDYSVNGTYSIELGEATDVELGGFYVLTDREERERSLEYDDPVAVTGPVPDGNLLTDASQFEDIDQENYSLTAKIDREWSAGESRLAVGFARFDESLEGYEDGIDFEEAPAIYEGQLTTQDVVDDELTVKGSHTFPLTPAVGLEIGVFWQQKDRDTDILEAGQESEIVEDLSGWLPSQRAPREFRGDFEAFEAVPGGVSKIEEDRVDAYALLAGEADRLAWEAGIRYETTDSSITDGTVDPSIASDDADYDFFLPSAHLRYDVTDADRLLASVARTVRRPEFDFLSPALLEAELGDNDLLGNAQLEPEVAWGVDLGYERRIGTAGIIGMNVFYRDVEDLIELANTGVEGSEGPGTFVLQPTNAGDGEVYGIELDLSTPLSFVGLDDTGLFLNYSWLDSDIDDVFGSRQFNDQSDYVYNVGFIQDLPAVAAAFGVTYRKQGDAFGRIVGEEVETEYDADLEVFVEKRIGESLTIRAVGSNLLDAEKKEAFNKFDTIEDQADRSFDEYELESEAAGAFYQLMVRYAF
jgi:outer membrane receptor protein involved in Fe transport